MVVADNGGGNDDNLVNLTFNVNAANIEVGPNGLYLGGGVFGDAQAHAMSDADGDGTWSVTLAVDSGLAGNYIFLNSPNDGGDWNAKENLAGFCRVLIPEILTTEFWLQSQKIPSSAHALDNALNGRHM